MRVIFVVALILMLVPPLSAQDEPITRLESPPDPAQYQLVPVVDGLSRPLYLTNAGDGSGRLFILEQTGLIRLLIDGELQAEPFMDMTGLVSQAILSGFSERGLLGLAFHPDFAENGQFFTHYNDPSGQTVLARYQVSADNPNRGDLASAAILFTHPQPFANHNGGQIAFGPDGYLYLGLGDGGSGGDPRNNGQNPGVLLGKILRIDVDGEAPYGIPVDNPIATVNPDLAPEIWAWGLRNPWRFSFDRATDDLYIADVGQNQWEEINFQPAGSAGGENYGWRILEGTHNFSGEPAPGNSVMPIAEYDHSQGCSVTGGYVYRGEELSELQGVYLFGDWCSGNIWASYRDLQDEWHTIRFIERTGMSISSFGEDEAGEIYVLDYSGQVMKLVATTQ